MANRKSSITAELKLNGKAQFKSSLNEASRDARVFGKTLENIGGKGIGSSMRLTELHSGLQLAGSAARIAGAAFKSAFSKDLNVEQLAMALSSVSDGTQTLAQQFAALKEAAKLPGLGFTEIAKGSLDLQSVGVSAEQSREVIIQLGNALASTGKGKAELEGITTALAQMYGKGKVSAEEINQIAERYPAIRAIAATLDKESPSKFTEGLSEALSKLPRATGTAQDAIDNLGDATDQFMTGKTGGGITNFVKDLADGASNAVNSTNGLADSFEKLGKGVRNAFTDRSGGQSLLEKYELSAEEIAKRQAMKKAAADAELREKERLLDAELDITRAENDLTEAKARNNEEAITSATQELAILKEKKKLMEAMGITEQQATDFIKKRVELERDGDKITRDAENRKQAVADKDELAMLEAKAGGASSRKMKKLEKNQRLSAEEDRLIKQGMNPDAAKAQASRKVEAEDRIAQDEDRAAMGLRPRIRGAGYKKKQGKSGLGSATYDGLNPEFQGLEALSAMQPDPSAVAAGPTQERKRIQGAGRDKAKIAERDKPADGVGGASQVIAALQRIEKAVRDTGPASNERGKPLSSVNR